jgi:hypothetical protein
MALNSNILIGYNDYVQNGAIYDQNVNTVAEDAFPLTNLLLPDLWQPTIFEATNQTIQFTIDLGAQKPVNLVALLKHNVNFTGKWRVYLNQDYDNDPLGQEYDSGWQNIIPPQPGFGALEWGAFQWNDALPEYNLGFYNRHAYQPLPTTIITRYITIAIQAPANTNPIRIFRLWASIGYQPSSNVEYGADITVIDDTKVVESAVGVRQYGDRVQRRQLNAGFDMLPRSEMLYQIVGGLYLASGISTPIIAILEPTDPSNFYAEAVYGNLTQLDKATYASWLRWATTFSIEEAV